MVFLTPLHLAYILRIPRFISRQSDYLTSIAPNLLDQSLVVRFNAVGDTEYTERTSRRIPTRVATRRDSA